jgi:hypothetical protein
MESKERFEGGLLSSAVSGVHGPAYTGDADREAAGEVYGDQLRAGAGQLQAAVSRVRKHSDQRDALLANKGLRGTSASKHTVLLGKLIRSSKARQGSTGSKRRVTRATRTSGSFSKC